MTLQELSQFTSVFRCRSGCVENYSRQAFLCCLKNLVLAGPTGGIMLLAVQEDTLLISIRGETARLLVTKKREAAASGSQAGAKSYV